MIAVKASEDIEIGDGLMLLFAQFGLLLAALWIVAKAFGNGMAALPNMTKGARSNAVGQGGKWNGKTGPASTAAPSQGYLSQGSL